MFIKSALALATVFSVSAYAAESITCTLEGEKKVVATLKAKGQSHGDRVYEITLDDSVSSGFLGVEDRPVFMDSKKKGDVLDDFDGNSEVKISFRKGFLSEKAGAKSRAFLMVDYNDIEQDHVSHVLTCTVKN